MTSHRAGQGGSEGELWLPPQPTPFLLKPRYLPHVQNSSYVELKSLS